MPNTKISALGALSTSDIAAGDQFVIVDVSDTTHAASGTTKKLAASGLVWTAGAQTISGTKTFDGGLVLSVSTMNHYEIGSWTPTLFGSTTAGTQTYTTQTGRFVRVGMLVVAWFQVALATLDGTAAGDVTMGGLPFDVRSTGAAVHVGSQVVPVNLTTSVLWLTVRAVAGTRNALFRKMTAAATQTTALVIGDISGTVSLNGTLIYEAV